MVVSEPEPQRQDQSRRKPSPHDVPPRTIVMIVLVMAVGLGFGMLLVMPHYGPRKPRHRSALGHALPGSMIGRETNGMMWVPGSAFLMGSNEGAPDERPVHEVTVAGFWMDKTEVTNEQFERFVQATGYVTSAEKGERRGGLVWQGASPSPGGGTNGAWMFVENADWRHPLGKGASVGTEPVVQVSWEDARAYAKWAGKRLPTEAEWEHAARGGLNGEPYVWGRAFNREAKLPANASDSRRPAAQSQPCRFPPNGYGLCDMAGNVWEWCSDVYDPAYYEQSPKLDPKGPAVRDAADGAERSIRGGSYLTPVAECRVAARAKFNRTASRSDLGFRCVAAFPR